MADHHEHEHAAREQWFAASAHASEGRYAEAGHGFERAAEEYGRIGHHCQRAVALTTAGSAFDQALEFDRALRLLTEAAAFLDGHTSPTDPKHGRADEVTNLLTLGVLLRRMGRPEEARSRYEQALAIMAANPWMANAAMAHLNLGAVNMDLRDYGRAKREFETAERLYRELDEPADAARAGVRIGLALMKLDRASEARARFVAALEQFRELPGTDWDIADVSMNIGLTHLARGENDSAVAHLAEAQQRFSAIPGTERERGLCQMNVGLVDLRAGRLDEAQWALEDAVSAFTGRPDSRRDLASALANRASLREARGDHAGAEADIRAAMGVAGEAGLGRPERSGLDIRLGLLELAQGRVDDARATLSATFEQYTNAQDGAWWDPALLLPLGGALTRLGEYADAEKAYAVARAWFSDRDDERPRAAHAVYDLANSYERAGDLAKAERAMLTAIAEYEILGEQADVAEAWVRVASHRFRMGRRAEAMDALHTGRRLLRLDLDPAKSDLMASGMVNLAAVVALAGDTELAETMLVGILTEGPAISDRLSAVCWGNLGTLYLDTGRVEAAEQAFERTREHLESAGEVLADHSHEINLARLLARRARDAAPERAAELIRRALDHAMPVILELERTRLTLPSAERRASLARAIADAPLPLVFRYAAELGDGTLIADLTAVFRSSGVAVAAESAAESGGLASLGLRLLLEASADDPSVLGRDARTAGALEDLLPAIGIGEVVARRASPDLVMPDGRVALAGYRRSPQVRRIRFV